MMQVNVTGGSIGQRELDAYIARANIKYPIGTVQTLDVHVDGEYVDLHYHLAPGPSAGSAASPAIWWAT